MQVGTLLQTDNHNNTHPTTHFFTGRMAFLPPNQQRQSTEGTRHVLRHKRQKMQPGIVALYDILPADIKDKITKGGQK